MHQLFVTPPQLRGMLRTLTLCLHFPIVTTILRGQLAGKTMTVLPPLPPPPPPQFFFYTAQQCLSMSIKPLHFLRIVEQRSSENTAHYIPSCSEALVKQWLQMTGALFIAYDALHMNIEFSATPKTSAGILFNRFPSTFPPHH